MSALQVWHFGCIGEAGHYLRKPDGSSGNVRTDQPWGFKIDTRLCPQPESGDGKTAEHHKDGWTAVAFWDYSGDSRPGSNSVFLVHAEATTEQVLEAARVQWPHLFARRGFPLAAHPDAPLPSATQP